MDQRMVVMNKSAIDKLMKNQSSDPKGVGLGRA